MRSAGEPGSREEETIPVRCRDTGSEGGGYEARLSDRLTMAGQEGASKREGDNAAMHSRGGRKRMWPRSRGERSHKVAETNFRKEGTQQSAREEEEKRSLCCGGYRG